MCIDRTHTVYCMFGYKRPVYRLYDSAYREEGLYEPSYRSPTYYISGSGTPGLSVDLPSPDSGIGPDQVTDLCIVSHPLFSF